MSSGFAGAATRSIQEDPEREIETRYAHFLTTNNFQTDFEPSSKAFVESDEAIVKRSGPYAKPHDDFRPEASAAFGRMAAAGRPEDQEPMDVLDREAQRFQSRIKDPADQFPGTHLKEKETFSAKVERRMRRLIRG